MSKQSNKFKERAITREKLMQLLYQMEVQGDFSNKEKESYTKTYLQDSSEKAYFDTMYDLVVKYKDSIDELIKKYSKNWAFERISKVDLSIMRLSIAEMLYYEDVPESVSINEAVELAKKFGGLDSGKFINGILGEITRSRKS